MRKLWLEEAWEEYISWQTKDKAVLKKINRLLKDIDRYGYECSGKPEPLKGDLSGYWSVHIDQKNRIVFRIDEEENLENDAYIKEKIAERNEAKKNKNYVLADEIRDNLLKEGIKLIDTREGTIYEIIKD